MDDHSADADFFESDKKKSRFQKCQAPFRGELILVPYSNRGAIHVCKMCTRFSLKQTDFRGFSDKTIGFSVLFCKI